MMTWTERAATHRATFPDRPGSWLVVRSTDYGDRVTAEWHFGADFRNRGSEFYGPFPGDFLDRLSAVFPDYVIKPHSLPFGSGRVLHAFSGSMPACDAYDRCDVVQPSEYQCDVRELPDHIAHPYDLVIADPPYSDEDAKKYKAPPLDRLALTNALARVTKVGGHLCWLDTVWPQYRSEHWQDVGHIYVLRSVNHRVRLLSIFERVEEEEST